MNNIKYRRWDFTWRSGYPQRSSWGCLLHQMNYIVARVDVPEWSPTNNRMGMGSDLRLAGWYKLAQPIQLQLGRYNLMRCNTLKHSLQRREVENRLVFWKKFTSETVSRQLRWQRGPFYRKRDATGKTWTGMQIKHAMTTRLIHLLRVDVRPMDERDEGSDRQSRSLVPSSVMGVKDARMTSVKEREIGWCENLSRMMNALL